MKRSVFAVLLFLFLAGSVHAQALGDLLRQRAGEGVSPASRAYSEYYRVQPSVIADLERRRLPEDDISVLLFLSRQQSAVPYDQILRWRLAGDSWWVITERLRLEPTVYYVPVPETVQPRPPFGRAYGYYRKHGHEGGKKTLRELAHQQRPPDFDDNDIRNLVQLRLVSNYYGYRTEEVMRRRERGEDFNSIIRVEYEKRHARGQWRNQEIREDRYEKGKHGDGYDDHGRYPGSARGHRHHEDDD